MGGSLPPALALGDAKLVAAVRRGDDSAFERIYDRHAGELLSFCRHMLRSRHEAEDALQQTFLKAYDALRRSDAPIRLRPWLFTIARNECISAMRRREVPTDEVHVETTPGLFRQVEAKQELEAMLADLARLPDEQREALLLTSFQALRGDQVADILGTDPARVKALVYRARRSLASTREAREAVCSDVRAQLSILRGGSLRRRVIREHVLACDGCREFRLEVRRQRQLVNAMLPLPLPLALKAGALPAISAGGLKAAVAGSGATAAGAAGVAGIAAKVAAGIVGLATVVAASPGGPLDDALAPAGASAGMHPALAGKAAAGADGFGEQPTGSLPEAVLEKAVADAGARASATGGAGTRPARDRPDAGVAVATAQGAEEDFAAEESQVVAVDPGGAEPGGAPAPAGESPTAPGLDGAPSGGGGIPPGHGVAPPGQSDVSVGSEGLPLGQGGTPPGQAAMEPGNGATPPGQGGTPPGLGGTPPGQQGKLPAAPRAA